MSTFVREFADIIDIENISPTNECKSPTNAMKTRLSLGDVASTEIDKMKNIKSPKRSIIKKLSTPVKTIRNLLPSVPSGWYGSASKSSKSGEKDCGCSKIF